MGMLRRGPGSYLQQKRVLVPLLSICLGAVACGRAAQQAGPEHAIQELQAALNKGDTKTAYGLMSEEFRTAHSLADFQKQLANNGPEAKALSEALAHRAQVRTYAEVELSRGDSLKLEEKSGRWSFVTPVLDFYPQATPREALASFVHAVEAARWDVVLALMPTSERGDLTAETLGKNLATQREELERMVALLKASMASPIEEVSDRATMPYGESYTARFVREDGLWKIEDPE